MKPTLKAPGCKRLKLESDDSLSIFAFNSNLRRYNEAFPLKAGSIPAGFPPEHASAVEGASVAAGAYTRSR
jgi:hypothetical protein